MVTDTTPAIIIKQNELGGYDTSKTNIVYSCNVTGRTYVRFADGTSCFLQDKTELYEGIPLRKKQND